MKPNKLKIQTFLWITAALFTWGSAHANDLLTEEELTQKISELGDLSKLSQGTDYEDGGDPKSLEKKGLPSLFFYKEDRTRYEVTIPDLIRRVSFGAYAEGRTTPLCDDKNREVKLRSLVYAIEQVHPNLRLVHLGKTRDTCFRSAASMKQVYFQEDLKRTIQETGIKMAKIADRLAGTAAVLSQNRPLDMTTVDELVFLTKRYVEFEILDKRTHPKEMETLFLLDDPNLFKGTNVNSSEVLKQVLTDSQMKLFKNAIMLAALSRVTSTNNWSGDNIEFDEFINHIFNPYLGGNEMNSLIRVINQNMPYSAKWIQAKADLKSLFRERKYLDFKTSTAIFPSGQSHTIYQYQDSKIYYPYYFYQWIISIGNDFNVAP